MIGIQDKSWRRWLSANSLERTDGNVHKT